MSAQLVDVASAPQTKKDELKDIKLTTLKPTDEEVPKVATS